MLLVISLYLIKLYFYIVIKAHILVFYSAVAGLSLLGLNQASSVYRPYLALFIVLFWSSSFFWVSLGLDPSSAF